MSRLERDRAAALEASKASQAKAKRENAKHTPGPWVVRTIDQSLATVETQDGEYIICNAAQLRDSLGAIGHVRMTEEEYQAIERILAN